MLPTTRTSTPMPHKTAVMTCGCFDPFHVGHLYHFQFARRLGDPLIVAVTKNGFVHKGEGRPMFDEKERAAVIKALAIVDDVILVESSIEALALVQPAVFCIGIEYKHKVRKEDVRYCRTNGIRIEFSDEKTYSSTRIVNDLVRQD